MTTQVSIFAWCAEVHVLIPKSGSTVLIITSYRPGRLLHNFQSPSENVPLFWDFPVWCACFVWEWERERGGEGERWMDEITASIRYYVHLRFTPLTLWNPSHIRAFETTYTCSVFTVSLQRAKPNLRWTERTQRSTRKGFQPLKNPV